MKTPERATLRIDRWLWHARFCKTRGLAAALVSAGRVRVNGNPIGKPGRAVAAGDVLTLAQHGRVRVIRIRELGERRGPASEAQGLYEDLDAPIDAPPAASGSPLE